MTVGRLLTCNGPCGAVVDVLEASDTGEHQWIDADQYLCGDCLELAANPATVIDTIERARRAQEVA